MRPPSGAIFVMNLPCRWALFALPGQVPRFGESYVPAFVHGDRDHTLDPRQMAYVEGARAIYHAIKRQLDVMDLTWVNPGLDPRFKAVDKARLAMEDELRKIGNWTDELLQTGVHEVSA